MRGRPPRPMENKEARRAAPSHLARLRERASLKNLPFVATWECTWRCNLRCVHCYLPAKGNAPPRELATGEARTLLAALAEAGFLVLAVTGGEPFERPDLLDLLAEARRLAFAVRLLTNATRIGAREADRLAGLGLLCVDVSLYGSPSAEGRAAHDAITRVPGSHAATVRALRLLAERGVRLTVKMPLFERNADEVHAVRRFAEALGASFVFDPTLFCRDDGDPAPRALRAPDAQVAEILASFGAKNGGTNLVEGKPVCNAGRNALAVGPDGTAHACVAIREPLGRLPGDDFEKIWRHPFLERLRAVRLSDLAACRTCEWRSFCVRCPGLALREDGDLLGCSSSACRMAVITARLARGADEGTKA